MGQSARSWQGKEKMKVIRRSSRSDEREALTARNAAQVGIEFGGAGGRDKRATLFGAEDAMNQIARIRVGHEHRPYRTPILQQWLLTPPLKRWANHRCAYGAK
jgi:hypothetical protein